MDTIENKIDDLDVRMNKLENLMIELKNDLKTRNSQTIDIDVEKTCLYKKEINLSETERAKIEDIMRDFNFEKVHNVMKMLDWKWAMTKYGVPTMDEIKAEAKRLLVEAANEKTCIGTGGFRAVYEKAGFDDPDPFISLEFIVEDCEGFEGDEDEDD